MSREFKHYELKAARVMRDASAVASVAVVRHASGKVETKLIAFSDSFVTSVGKKLPRGVSAQDPACIEVTHTGTEWIVEAVYIQGHARAILWRSATAPIWLNIRKEPPHGNSSSRTGRNRPSPTTSGSAT